MTTTPPDAPSGSTEPPGPPGPPSSWVDPEPPPSSGPRVTRDEAKDLGRIRRSLTDRKIAGVAGGIARHFDIDPLLVRVGLVLLAIFGGGGILLYAAGWLLIPEEGSDDGMIKVDHRTRTVLLAVVGAIAALSLLGDSFGGWEFPWPLAIIGLVIAAIAAASRPKPHPGPLPGHGWIPPGTPGAVPGAQTGAGPTYPGYQPGLKPQPVDTRRRGPLLFWFTMALALVGVVLVATFDLAGWDAPISAYPGRRARRVRRDAAGRGVLRPRRRVDLRRPGRRAGDAGGTAVAGRRSARRPDRREADDGGGRGRPVRARRRRDHPRPDRAVARSSRSSTADDRGRRAASGTSWCWCPRTALDVDVDSHIEGAGESVLFGDRTRRIRRGRPRRRRGATSPRSTLDLEVLFGQIEVRTKEAA